MIRAHLATFPVREGIFRRVIRALLPQVDRLFLVLNEYRAVPADIAEEPRITAILPGEDYKDAGKFYFAPAPDDIVFTVDDDIGYPSDYVARTLKIADQVGLDDKVLGYQGHVFLGQPGVDGTPWDNFFFHQGLDRMTGLSLIGTGTVCALGRCLPRLAEMAPFRGLCDIGLGRWMQPRGILPWALPRATGWLTNDLPKELRPSSLFNTVNRRRDPAHAALLSQFIRKWPHAGKEFPQALPSDALS